jgi:tyrosine-protein phosphatase YwqE
MLFFQRPSGLPPVDIHSHLIPGVDDGSKSTEETIKILQAMGDLGVKKMITTPHIYHDLYPNTEAQLISAHQHLVQELSHEGVEVEVELAAEYFMDEYLLEKIKKKLPLLSFGDNYLLVETGFNSAPAILEEVIFEIKINGYKPLLAHPERYEYLFDNEKMIKRLIDLQVEFQVSVPSLGGMYGPEIKKMAQNMIKNRYVHCIGSDLHRYPQVEMIKKAARSRYLDKAVKKGLINHHLEV